jgi:ABC-type branched-subunit amino acid transport system ATPase component
MARVMMMMMSSPSVVLLDEPSANLAPMPSAQLLEHDVPALAAAAEADRDREP